MGYFVYDKATTRIVGKSSGYKTHSAAVAAITKMGKGMIMTETHPVFTLGIAEESYFYRNIEKKVRRVNLATKEEFYEPVNTPSYCSPASESYWSS